MSTRKPFAPAGAPPIRSWNDGYAALRRRAGETRGWIELDSDVPNRRWPRTTGLDVIVIAAFIDAAFSTTDQVTYAGTVLRWVSCKDDIERDALHALGDIYRGNRDFWDCLAMMCAHLAHVGCPLPAQAIWSGVLAEIGVALRTPLDADSPPIWFAGAESLDKLYLAQRQYLARVRGADRLEPQPGMSGGTMLIPRTTNADVLELAGFWSAVLRIEKAKRTNGYDTVMARWRAALDEMVALTEHASPAAVYPRNHAFWRAASSVAVHVAAAVQYGLSDAELRREIGGQLRRLRNALAAQDRPPVWFAGAGDLAKLYLAQRAYLANLHGSDKLAPEPDMTGGVTIVPRSTNAEVIQLAAFWTQALESEKAKHANGYDTVRERWAAALRDIDAHARGQDPNAAYPKNHAFWRAISSVAIHVAASNEHGLTDAQAWMGSVGETLQTVGERTKALATAIATSVRDGAAEVVHGAGKVLNEGARGLFGGLATPFLIGGGALAAFLLLRGRGDDSREAR